MKSLFNPMAENSKIEWCDHTFNPWIGCTKVSPGCANCYAETLDRNRYSKTLGGGTKDTPMSHWGYGAPRHRTSTWGDPVKWNRDAYSFSQCPECGWRGDRNALAGTKTTGNVFHCPECDKLGVLQCKGRPRVFCASLSDWLDDEVPDEWLADLLKLIHDTPNLDWQLLTKRPENWESRIEAALRCIEAQIDWDKPAPQPMEPLRNWLADWFVLRKPPANIWIGTTVEDQKRADERIPHLLQIPAKVRFLSCEPLLGSVSLRFECDDPYDDNPAGRIFRNALDPGFGIKPIHWVIAGGESGPKARPMHPDWARSLRDQCEAAGVPFLFKQWGEWTQRCLLKIDGKPYGGSTDFAKLDPMCTRWPHSLRMCSCGGDTRTDSGPLPMCRCGDANDLYVQKVGKKAAGRLLDGQEHNGFPTI